MRRHPRLAHTLATAGVGLCALLAVVWVAPRADGAVATWLRTPSVRLHALTTPGGELSVHGPAHRAGAPVTLDAGMDFFMAGVVCDAPGGPVTVRLRTSLDGAVWGRWFEAPLELAGEAGSATASIDPVWTGEARFVQVAAAAGSQRGPASLSGVRLVAIDPTGETGSVAIG